MQNVPPRSDARAYTVSDDATADQRYWLQTTICIFFKFWGDRQMTEIFVSGTEVFSDAKMTETPYEWRRVDMYA